MRCKLLIDTLQFTLMTAGMAALYRYVPNTRVRWGHALLGGLFVAAGLELAKKLLAWYLLSVPTYSMVYGTFAIVPILLVWIYLAWVIVLLGAVVAAYLPSLLSGIARRGDTPGWNYQLALELVDQLQAARSADTLSAETDARGLSLEHLARALRVDGLQLEEPLRVLRQLDWAGSLDEEQARWVLAGRPRHHAAGTTGQQPAAAAHAAHRGDVGGQRVGTVDPGAGAGGAHAIGGPRPGPAF